MELKKKITLQIQSVVRQLFDVDIEVELTVPDAQFGDFSTNVAMQLAKTLDKSPRNIADEISHRLSDDGVRNEVAGPGFINIHVKNSVLAECITEVLDKGDDFGSNELYKDKIIVAEYSDLNAFKTAHAGHLYTTLVGDAISNLFEAAGATVQRTNFGGDVGLHVGKAMWAILRNIQNEPAKLGSIPEIDRSSWVSARYIEGNDAYESDDEEAKREIAECNRLAYQVHAENDHESVFAKVYWECRQWSYDGFEKLYDLLDIAKPEGSDLHFRYYPESETAPFGIALVEEGLRRGIFEKSDSAVVYKGEQDGLHTRVFMTSAGLPTYETKDLGLAERKWQDYHFDLSFMVTGNEIKEYMKVVLSALSHFRPEIAERTRHLTHGMVKLEGGLKMSSRKGTVVLPEEVLEAARLANKEVSDKDQPGTVLAAVKYAFLKQRLGGDIIYSPTDSVSTIGNSGPYLQYAHARARSIITKSNIKQPSSMADLDASEHSLAKKVLEFPDVVSEAVNDLMPHHVCTYLYELTQEFNRFYETSTVVGDERETQRIALLYAYTQVLANGLKLLGIQAPEKM